jgi:hypothetical protein
MNALVVIDTLTPAIFTEPGGIEAIISKLEADVRSIDTDISTPAGRAAIKSLAHKVARSKTALDDMGKALVADLKKQTGAVDADRKVIRDRLDALKDEVRKPLTDWEDAESARLAGHQNAIQAIVDLSSFDAERPAAAGISARLAELEALPDRDWQEFAKPAGAARADTFAKLTILKAAAVKFEAEQAELARLRAEQAVREQKERDERIAAEAAAKARLVAEAKAAREAKEAADRAEVARRKIEQDHADAVARAVKAERDAAAAKAKAAKDKKDAADKADREKTAAVKAERDRALAVQAAEEAATAKRAADQEHKARINSEALAALVAAGLSNADGVKAITAIVRGNVPHVKISY